jgi:hypothetical protein
MLILLSSSWVSGHETSFQYETLETAHIAPENTARATLESYGTRSQEVASRNITIFRTLR